MDKETNDTIDTNDIHYQLVQYYYNYQYYYDLFLRKKLFLYRIERRTREEILRDQQAINNLLSQSRRRNKNKDYWSNPKIQKQKIYQF